MNIKPLISLGLHTKKIAANNKITSLAQNNCINRGDMICGLICSFRMCSVLVERLVFDTFEG